jgi:ABC-type Na+ efflux pump permease subunit
VLTQTLAVISVLLTLGLAAVSAFVVMIRGGQLGLEKNNEVLDKRVQILERELAAVRAERDAALVQVQAVEAERDAISRVKTNDAKIAELAAKLDAAIADLGRHNAEARKHWRHEDEVGDSMVQLLTNALNRRSE